MVWQTKTVLICTPAQEGAETSPVCPAGNTVSSQTLYISDTDPSLPTHNDVQYGVVAFSIVITVYVLASGVGALLKLLKSDA